jgi:hypothetical protein
MKNRSKKREGSRMLLRRKRKKRKIRRRKKILKNLQLQQSRRKQCRKSKLKSKMFILKHKPIKYSDVLGHGLSQPSKNSPTISSKDMVLMKFNSIRFPA